MADNFTIMLGPYEGATIEEATALMRNKAALEVFEEKLSKLAPQNKQVNPAFINGECAKLLSKALANLVDGEGDYSFDNLFKNLSTTLNTFGSGGQRKLKFKAKVQADTYLNFLTNVYNSQPGCNTSNLVGLMFGDSAPVDAPETAGPIEGIENIVEDEEELTPPTSKELEDYGVTDSGLSVFQAEVNKAKQKIQQNLNQNELLSSLPKPPENPGPSDQATKLTVPLIDPKELDATHVVLKKSKKPPLLRSKPAVAANKSKPWKALINGTVVKVIKQNVGRGGKFHEVEVKAGEFDNSKGFMKTSELRPLVEGVLFDAKSIEQPEDVRPGGYASNIPTDWRKRQPGTPYLIVDQENPEESSYELTIRTKFANFGTKSEKVFVTEYAALGIYEIFNFYNKDFKIPINKDTEEPSMTPAQMSVLLASSGFTIPSEKGFPAEWHLDTATASARILIYVRIPIKTLDQFPKRLETFEFDKVIEGEEQPTNTDGLIGSKKQVTAAQQMFLDAAYLPQASVPDFIKINNFVPSNTLTCRFGHLQENIEALKEIMAYYDAAIKQDSEGRIASFPFGPIRGPLDLLKESERLDLWKTSFEEFLKINDYDYNGEPCTDSSPTSSPKDPQPEDVIEFGWNTEYQLVYILFNGQPLNIGLKYHSQRSALKLQRMNFFIHNAFDVRADPVFGQIAAEKGSGEATRTEDSPARDDESSNVSQNEKIGIVTEFKDDPAKRKPWTEWVIEYVYKDAFILPSSSREDSKIKEFEFKEGPYSEPEMIKIEKDLRADPGKNKVHIKTKKTTFETMDAHVQNIEEISKRIQGLEQAYNMIINKIGVKPLADAIMNCLMKQLPTVEDVMIAIGLGDVFKDTQKAIQFIGDILASAETKCTTKVLSEALFLEYEKTPEQEIPGIGNYDGTTGTITGAQEVPASDAASSETIDEPSEPDEPNESGESSESSGVEAHLQIVAIRTSMIPKIFKGVFKDKISNYGIDFDFQNDPEVVKKAQQGLNAWIPEYGGLLTPAYNPEPLAVDGIFGPETEEQAKKFNEIATSDTIDIGEAGAGGISIDGYPLEGLTKAALDNVYGKYLDDQGDPETTGEETPSSADAQPNGDPDAILLKEGSRDKKAGLDYQVTKWQQFLVATNAFNINPPSADFPAGDEIPVANAPSAYAGIRQEGDNKYYLYDDPENPSSHFNPASYAKGTAQQYWPGEPGETWFKTDFPIDGIFGPKTELATKNWLIGAGQIAATDESVWFLGNDPSDQVVSVGTVTNKQFKFAKSVVDGLANSAEAKKLDELLDPSQANKLNFIGPRPPAGFYCRLGAPGPCDRIYAEIIKIGRKIAASEAQVVVGGSTAVIGDIQKLIQDQDALKIKYANCMSSAEEEPVIGEGKDQYTGSEGTEEEQATQMANLVVKVEAKCNDLRNELITNLANAGVEDLTMWPGDDYIDKIADEKLAANLRDSLRRYTECYNAEITEIRTKFLENNLFAPDSYLSTITEVYPFPRTVEEAWQQFRATGRFPTNVSLNPEFNGDRLVKLLTEDPDCGIVMEKFIDLLLEFVPPPTRQVLKQLIKGALDGSFAAMFNAANIPEIPTPPEVNIDSFRGLVRRTGDPDGLLKLMMETALEQMLEELITGTIKILAQFINEACDDAESKGRNEGFGDLTASDIFNGRPNSSVELPDLGELQDRLRELQGELNDWNLPFDVTPNGSSAPGATYSYWEVVDEMSLLFTPTQLCSLFNGEGGFVLMVTVREFLEERYEPISSMLPSEDDLREFLMVLGKYADPQICLDVRDGKFANPVPTFGDKYCPPDLIENRKLSDCLKAGLTEEQCKEMLQRERDDTINAVQGLANLDFTLPEICSDIADMKEKLPGLQAALKRMLQDIADSVTMVFNADTGYFVPALIEDNKLFDLDQAIESLPDILKALSEAESSGNSGNGSSDGIASIPTFALQCLKATIPLGVETNESGEETAAPNQLDNLDAEKQTKLAEEISKNQGPSESEKLGKDVFGKKINIDQGESPPSTQKVKDELFSSFWSTAPVGQGAVDANILKNLSADKFVANSLRKALKSRFEVRINLEESSVILQVPRKGNNKLIYKTLSVDALIDSFYIDIREKGERFIFENSRYINESVQIYAKQNDMLATGTDLGSFDGQFAPQLIMFDKIISNSLNLSEDELQKEAMDNLYQDIRRDLIFKMRKQISLSKFFKKTELENLDLTPASRDAKDECGIPVRVYEGGVKVASLLNPDKFIDEAIKSYTEATAKECETGPSDTPPLQQAVSEMALKMYIRTFVVNSSLNTLFMLAKFKVEDYFDDKVFLEYLMKFIKDDLLERRIYTEGKDIAKSIIFKRSERGDEILPKLTTGYDCIKFLTQEQFADVSDQFRMILASSIKNNELYDYNKDKFLSLAVLNQPKHVFPYNLANDQFEVILYPGEPPHAIPSPMPAILGDQAIEDVAPLYNVIEDEINTLGFDTITDARDFYHQKNRETLFTDVLEKESFFILEPYLRVKDKAYNNHAILIEELKDLGYDSEEASAIVQNYSYDEQSGFENSDLYRPVNLLIAPFINAQYAVGLANTEPGQVEVLYDSVSIEDDLYNWNTGLVNYVNMKEYSKFLKSIYELQIKLQQAVDSAEQTIEQQTESNQQIIEEYENYQDEFNDSIANISPLNQEIFNAMHWKNGWHDDIAYYSANLQNDDFIRYEDFFNAYSATGIGLLEISSKFNDLLDDIRTIEEMFFFKYSSSESGQLIDKERFAQYYPRTAVNTEDSFVYTSLKGLSLPQASDDQHISELNLPSVYGESPSDRPGYKAPFTCIAEDNGNSDYDVISYPSLYSMLSQLINHYPIYSYWLPETWQYVKRTWLQQWVLVSAQHSITPEEDLPLGKEHPSRWPNTDNWTLDEVIHPVYSGLLTPATQETITKGIGYPADYDPEEYKIFSEYNNMTPECTNIMQHNYDYPGSLPSTLLTDGTSRAVQLVWSVLDRLREFKIINQYDDSYAAASELAELDIESINIAKNIMPSRMKDIVDLPLSSLIDDGYFNSISWGLRLSYVSNEENIPEQVVEILEDQNRASLNGRYLIDDPNSGGAIAGLRTLDGAPQTKVQILVPAQQIDEETAPGSQTAAAARKYYTIPIVEKEISIKQKFLTDENGEQSLGQKSISGIFGTIEPSMDESDLPYIEDFYYKYVHEDLVNQIKQSEEYNALFDYALPLRRYVTLNSINIMMTMTKLGPGPLMYSGTRDILQSLITSALRGSGAEGFDFDDPQLAALGGPAAMFSDAFNSKNFEPKKMNLGLMILKLFLETPFKILKGVTEAFDPNILIIDKILKVLKIIIETLPTKADPCIVEPVFLTYIADHIEEIGAPEGTALSASKLRELKEKAQTDMDRKLRKIKNTLKDVLENMPVPLISIAMLPSMLPYGCGFPPPPLGPGIGPPLTPFGVAYLVLGLYRDISFGDMADISERSTDDDLPDDIEILCKEKHEAYQRLVAQGQLDFEPMDDDD